MSVRQAVCGAVWLALVGSALNAAAAPPAASRPKKLIALGWDMPNQQQLRPALAQLERLPLDGLAIELTTPQAPEKAPFAELFSARDWSRSWFEPTLAELKKCAPSRPVEMFVHVATLPGGVDWFDDAAWRNIVAHWRIAAWLVRKGGCKGILFDPEAYQPASGVFRYPTQPQASQHDFAAYCAQARRRGREVLRAVAEECPELTLFCLFMNSACATAAGQSDPSVVLHEHLYGLLPAFIDGWLDAAPPTLTFVDGCEQAYLFNRPEQFLQAGHTIHGPCQELVSPENRAKYRAQVQVGFGILLDAYANPKTSPWSVDGQGGSRVARLGANVASALYAADEYVWLYGEQYRWWPADDARIKKQTWPEVLPFCDEYLRCARDPLGFARTRLKQIDRGRANVNLIESGQFDGDPKAAADVLPPAWSTWQAPRSHGLFALDRQTGHRSPGAARIYGALNACLLQARPVKPGERYIVRVYSKVAGQGEALLQVRWQTAPGRFSTDAPDRLFFATGARGQWREILGVVEVPPGATRLVVVLSVYGQTAPQDCAWFDDVAVFPLVLEQRP